MSEIIANTPIWVFIVFFTLLLFGVIQTKERTIKTHAIFILPLTMILFSFFGVYSVFGLSFMPVIIWCFGIILTVIIGLKLSYPKQLVYLESDSKLIIPGSKIPLLFMMAIFFTKYFVGFALARSLPIVNEIFFLVIISFFYGFFSGVFLSRSLVMYKETLSD